ncbi:MAG: hypothetical protein SFW67_09945 [Myxococcaceae bacterium]|nr:hypothetical protein [Myxococcaceae bacterium]
MATERVDKGWQLKGLEAYGDDAILGTLAHYGITIDKPGFLALAQKAYPLAIAMEWHEGGWKGTGQFSRFPAAAAEELWHRWQPGAVAPTDVALAIINLIKDLVDQLDGKPDEGTLDTRFKVVEAYLPRIPTEPETRDRFLGECFGALTDWMEPFDGMAESLARKKLDALADRFAALEEGLLEQRRGISSAIVRAVRGDETAALNDVFAIAMDASREVWNRSSAIDTLFDFEALDRVKQATLSLFDEAERLKDLELISWCVETLAELLKEDPSMPERQAIRERIERIAAALGPEHGEP